MEFKCDICNRDFNSEESLNQHNAMKHFEQGVKESGKVNPRRYIIFSIIALIVILSSFSVYSYMKKPGGLDEFAKCLSEKGVVIYGNDFCSYTVKQLGMFGKSRKYLNYVKCVDNEKLCNEKGVEITPTWEIKEFKLDGVQSLERLGELSGCVV